MGNPISREVFLQRARSRFGERYDYSAIVYKSFKTPIRIRCSIHPVKEISITPEKHLQTTGGCTFCLRERELGRQSAERPLLSAVHTACAARPSPAAAPPVAPG